MGGLIESLFDTREDRADLRSMPSLLVQSVPLLTATVVIVLVLGALCTTAGSPSSNPGFCTLSWVIAAATILHAGGNINYFWSRCCHHPFWLRARFARSMGVAGFRRRRAR